MSDAAKASCAALCLIGGMVLYYVFPHWGFFVRLGVVLLGVLLFLLLMYWTKSGQLFCSFLRDSYREILKIVWPSGRETIHATLVVFLFVVVMAAYLWIVDKILKWLLYSVILGWKL